MPHGMPERAEMPEQGPVPPGDEWQSDRLLFLVDEAARLIAMNTAAADACAQGDWIAIDGTQTLIIRDAALNQKFRSAIYACFTSNTRQVARIDDNDGAVEKFLIVKKIASVGGGTSQPPGESFLVHVRTPRDHIKLHPEELEQIFDLTPTEARLVLALTNGVSLKAFAEQSHTELSTVRWHLANARSKTGARNQLDLVRLVLAIDL
jgi:DNA-binding CsgD family transcriptional regulator